MSELPMLDLAAILLTGVLLASAQACMTLYARRLPRRLSPAIRYSASSLNFYAFVVLYALATVLAVYLFARLSLAHVSVSVMAVTFLALIGYSALLRQQFTWRQGAGVLLVFIGFYLLQ